MEHLLDIRSQVAREDSLTLNTGKTYWFLNRNELPYPSAQKKFIEDLRLASQTADFLWGNILVQLPRSKRRNYVPGQDVLVLGEASIPNNVADLLRLGPKYCEHPDLDKTELLSLVRTAAGKASMDESDRCVREGVDCLPQRNILLGGTGLAQFANAGFAQGRRFIGFSTIAALGATVAPRYYTMDCACSTPLKVNYGDD
ncbi:hypothetical protein MRX96_031059 [Rhipicephalus microplus]